MFFNQNKRDIFAVRKTNKFINNLTITKND